MSDETHDSDRKLPAAKRAGARIHMAMWERRIRQADLAARVGMSQSTLSKKLRGEVPMTVDELVTIAHALGIPACELLEEGEEVPVGGPLPHRHQLGAAS